MDTGPPITAASLSSRRTTTCSRTLRRPRMRRISNSPRSRWARRRKRPRRTTTRSSRSPKRSLRRLSLSRTSPCPLSLRRMCRLARECPNTSSPSLVTTLRRPPSTRLTQLPRRQQPLSRLPRRIPVRPSRWRLSRRPQSSPRLPNRRSRCTARHRNTAPTARLRLSRRPSSRSRPSSRIRTRATAATRSSTATRS